MGVGFRLGKGDPLNPSRPVWLLTWKQGKGERKVGDTEPFEVEELLWAGFYVICQKLNIQHMLVAWLRHVLLKDTKLKTSVQTSGSMARAVRKSFGRQPKGGALELHMLLFAVLSQRKNSDQVLGRGYQRQMKAVETFSSVTSNGNGDVCSLLSRCNWDVLRGLSQLNSQRAGKFSLLLSVEGVRLAAFVSLCFPRELTDRS